MTEQTTTLNERFAIRTGTPVIAGLDQIGRVDRVVMKPGTGEVAGLIVRKGLLLTRDVVIPIEAVEEATEHEVRVNLTVDELNRAAQYGATDGQGEEGRESRASASGRGDLRAAQAGQTPAAVGGKPLRAGQKVFALDGEVGRLDLVLIDAPTRRVSYLVVRRGRLLVHDTLIPVEWIKDVGQDTIVLNVTRERLAELPEYRPDDEIAADVLDALWYRADLRPIDLQFVDVHVRDGIVELEGHTHNERTRQLIEEAARGVKGVMGVRNHLDTFEELEKAIKEAQRTAGRRRVPKEGATEDR
jgi:uncharacterized protein YrrD